MHYAAQQGHLSVVQHICGHLEDKNPKDSNGFTPLHLAAANGHLEVVKHLTQFVDDLHPKNGVCWGPKTPLDFAEEKGHHEIVDYLKNPLRAQMNQVENCSICFEPRIETYALSPCGHASFCAVCALRLFESRERRCPNCRKHITNTMQLFLK